MPRKKVSNRISVKQTNPKSDKVNGFWSQIKWGESYTSLFLGAVVIIVALFLVFSFLKSKNLSREQSSSSSATSQLEVQKKSMPKTYVIKEGDDLWHIAESIYGSGYNWVDLAKENNLSNPSVISAGIKLSIPDVKARTLTTIDQQSVISGGSYTVEKGDYLWEIAVRAYGDGYKWVDIAKANNLSNPDLIHSGNVLKLPR